MASHPHDSSCPAPNEERIAELETRITFQEDVIEQLQRTQYEQTQLVDRLADRLQSLAAVVRQGQGMQAGEGQEPPPPHY